MRARFERTTTRSSALPNSSCKVRLERETFCFLETAQRQEVRRHHLHPNSHVAHASVAASELHDLGCLCARSRDSLGRKRSNAGGANLCVYDQAVVAEALVIDNRKRLFDGTSGTRRIASFEPHRRVGDERLDQQPRVVAIPRPVGTAQSTDQLAAPGFAPWFALAMGCLCIDQIAARFKQTAPPVVVDAQDQAARFVGRLPRRSEGAQFRLEFTARAQRGYGLRYLRVAR